jgi:hypothetical protein
VRVLIDTNILLRAVQQSHPGNRTARMALLALHRKGDTMCLTLQESHGVLERMRETAGGKRRGQTAQPAREAAVETW